VTIFKHQVLIRLCAAALGVMAAHSAQADCGPVIAAFQKAYATERFAWFTVTDVNQTPNGDPIMVSIGDVSYVPVEAGPKFKGKFQTTGFLNGVLSDSLRRHESEGKASCKPLADRTLRGEPAVGFNVSGGVTISGSGSSSEDIWISRGTGLPIIQGMDSTGHGGVLWVYGAAVSAPPPEKLLK
jgi:hypothetical protein